MSDRHQAVLAVPVLRRLAASALVVAALASCGGEDTPRVAPLELSGAEREPGPARSSQPAESTTTEPNRGPDPSEAIDSADEICSIVDSSLLRPVMERYPDDDEDRLLEAIEILAARADDPVSVDADAVVALFERDGDRDAAEAGLEAVNAWVLDHCSADHVVWACGHPWGTRELAAVGEGADSGVGPATPEEAVDDLDFDGEREELERDEFYVSFVWLDADGHAVAAASVEEWDGWVLDRSIRCN